MLISLSIFISLSSRLIGVTYLSDGLAGSGQHVALALDQRPVAVLFGECGHRLGPLNAKGRIVESRAPAGFGSIKRRSQVQDLSVVLEALESVCALLRYVQHAAILRCQFHPAPLAIGK